MDAAKCFTLAGQRLKNSVLNNDQSFNEYGNPVGHGRDRQQQQQQQQRQQRGQQHRQEYVTQYNHGHVRGPMNMVPANGIDSSGYASQKQYFGDKSGNGAGGSRLKGGARPQISQSSSVEAAQPVAAPSASALLSEYNGSSAVQGNDFGSVFASKFGVLPPTESVADASLSPDPVEPSTTGGPGPGNASEVAIPGDSEDS